MGLFSRSAKKDLKQGGVTATAVLHSRTRLSHTDTSILDNVFVRSARFRLGLEIHVPGRAPYLVEDEFDVARHWWTIAKGLELPVRVDPAQPQRVLIDWDAFEAAGGKQVVRELGDKHRLDPIKERNLNDPTVRANAAATVGTWVDAVRAGHMSYEDLSKYIDEYVERGELSAEEAQSAKQSAAREQTTHASEAYPPVEGVDYETWIRAIVGITRNKIRRSEHDSHYVSCGFPPGRGDAISAVWYERVKADPALSARYMRDVSSPPN